MRFVSMIQETNFWDFWSIYCHCSNLSRPFKITKNLTTEQSSLNLEPNRFRSKKLKTWKVSAKKSKHPMSALHLQELSRLSTFFQRIYFNRILPTISTSALGSDWLVNLQKNTWGLRAKPVNMAINGSFTIHCRYRFPIYVEKLCCCLI